MPHIDRGTPTSGDGEDTPILPATGQSISVPAASLLLVAPAAGTTIGAGGTLYGADGNDTLVAGSGAGPLLIGGSAALPPRAPPPPPLHPVRSRGAPTLLCPR